MLKHWLCDTRCAACDIELWPRAEGFCDGCELLIERASTFRAIPARHVSLFVYGGPLRDAILRLKLAGHAYLAPVLAELITQVGGQLVPDDVDAVVPIPLHRSRLRQRGFNQTLLLAHHAQKALGVRVRPEWLDRTKKTNAQAELPASERIANVKGAFRASREVRGRHVLLFDDVRTTGATLAAAELALRIAGAAEVSTLTLAVAEAS